MTEKVYALVDYDNARSGRARGGRGQGNPPSYRDHEDLLQKLVESLVAHAIAQTSGFFELSIRLYGGWIDETGRGTGMHDMLAKAIRQTGANRRARHCRIHLSIADAPLAAPSAPLPSTFRTLPWRTNIKPLALPPKDCVQTPNVCAQAEGLLKWTRGNCPQAGCSQKSAEAFTVEVQKLVDSLIIADSHFAQSIGATLVLVVSRDEDMVPGLLSARALGGAVHWIRLGRGEKNIYDHIVRGIGVEIFDLPVIA